MGITHLCENAHFTYKIFQYTCFNCTCYTCSYDKCVWDMSQCNKLSDIQYARFQILPVDLHFGLFWSAGIPTMSRAPMVEHETNNLRVDSSSSTLGTGRHGPPIQPAAKWVPDIWTRMASWLFTMDHSYIFSYIFIRHGHDNIL